MKRGNAVLFDDTVTADPNHGNHLSAEVPTGSSGEPVKLTIATADGKELIAAEANGGGPRLAVSADQLDAALDELMETRNAMTRTLLGGRGQGLDRLDQPEVE